jgi:hypothetical protein
LSLGLGFDGGGGGVVLHGFVFLLITCCAKIFFVSSPEGKHIFDLQSFGGGESRWFDRDSDRDSPERDGSLALFKHKFCSNTLKNGSGVGGRLLVVFQFESKNSKFDCFVRTRSRRSPRCGRVYA